MKVIVVDLPRPVMLMMAFKALRGRVASLSCWSLWRRGIPGVGGLLPAPWRVAHDEGIG